jgi:hypothetical protein
MFHRTFENLVVNVMFHPEGYKRVVFFLTVLRIRIRRIRMFLGLLDLNLLIRCTNPDHKAKK